MRKLLIGCGLLALLGFCLLVGAGIWGVRKVNAYAKSFQTLQSNYQALQNQYPFAAPDPPVMKDDRLRDFLAVRKELADGLKSEADLVGKLQSAAQSQQQGAGQRPNLSFGDLKAMVSLPLKVGEIHLKALEKRRMSPGEYLWHSRVVTATLLKSHVKVDGLQDRVEEAYGQFAQSAGIPSNSPVGQSPDLSGVVQAFGAGGVPVLPENEVLIEKMKDDILANTEMLWIEFFLQTSIPGSGPAAGNLSSPTSATMDEEKK